jgi:predicted Zn-dependent protease
MYTTRNRIRRWGAVALCAAAIAGCARNPVTGKTELALVSEAQEIEMGRQGAQEVAQSIGLVNDEALQSYVHQIGAKLAAASERPNLPWQFRVVDDASPNAFALPGGFIFVTRGILSLMDSEAELASVLGHEIGHVTARHSVSQMSKAQLAQIGLGLAMIIKPELQQFGNLAGQGLQLLFLKYGRDDENQADDLGFRYSLDQGYDIREMADVFASLDRISAKSNQGKLPEWLSTHPDPGNRIKKTEDRIAKLNRPLTGLKEGEPEYMQRIQGIVYGDNPRNGFFQGSNFLHPDLRFQMTFPSGWQAQNTPQAVIAVSPQQDAMIQLTLAQGASPSTAAQRFFSQQGIQLLRQPVSENVNGNPAVVGYFQAQTEQGVIGGLATFLSYGGRTYQLLAYTPSQLLGQYDRTFLQTIGSFSELRDPTALAVQPNKVNVVRLAQSMTLAEFNQRYPSAVPIEDLAIINQVDTPSSQLAAGTLVKQVQGTFVPGR